MGGGGVQNCLPEQRRKAVKMGERTKIPKCIHGKCNLATLSCCYFL